MRARMCSEESSCTVAPCSIAASTMILPVSVPAPITLLDGLFMPLFSIFLSFYEISVLFWNYLMEN